METIVTMDLKAMSNALFVQFMSDVDAQVQRVTPDALKVKKCYAAFTDARTEMDGVYLSQKKDNDTAKSDAKDIWRDEMFRCFSGHINAALFSYDPKNREYARVLRNKLNAYGNLTTLGNVAESAKMEDLGRDLLTSPWKEAVEALGLADERDAMILANKEFVELSRTRIEKRKLVLVTMKSARENIGEAYRNLVTLINSQIMVQNLKDEESGGEEDRPGELSVLVDTPEDPYTDFVRSLNVLIKDYKTRVAQSGKRKKDDERPGEL
ncbi:DUF6261 family protein [uncultured Parabacteroides sp.]|jgi:hypothetical protein|uniref:DUF6261 family protein n=2 Tax=Parabacteroides TaxID=375288 RepID=UPI0025EE6C3F|nr:DUF6261 family protein [uncultured Parabacteroides sp.]